MISFESILGTEVYVLLPEQETGLCGILRGVMPGGMILLECAAKKSWLLFSDITAVIPIDEDEQTESDWDEVRDSFAGTPAPSMARH